MKIFLWIIAVCLSIAYWPILVLVATIFGIWKLYEYYYYNSPEFTEIRQRIEAYTNDCNELNKHIESLKDTALLSNQKSYGQANYHDSSQWNFKRKHLNSQKYTPYVYNCSRTVCDNARKKPFEYVCKYFEIPITETSLARFEEILNNFEAAEEGKKNLQNEKMNIINSVQTDIPFLIKKLSKNLEKKLGFEPIDMSSAYFPKYVFKYISSGGNASTQCDVTMDINNLNDFIQFLSAKIKFKNSAAGQRALMTSKLRQRIKERDGYTCKKCSASIQKEPNLLLEIDHIIPISRGGLTTEDNLQTLCWRCNRSKGSKIE